MYCNGSIFNETDFIINLLLDKTFLPILEMLKLGVSEREILKVGKKAGTLEIF